MLNRVADIFFLLVLFSRSILKVQFLFLLIGGGLLFTVYGIDALLGVSSLLTLLSIVGVMMIFAEECFRASRTRQASLFYDFLADIVPGYIRYLRGVRDTTSTLIIFSGRDYAKGSVIALQWVPAVTQGETERLASAIGSHIVLWKPERTKRPPWSKREKTLLFNAIGIAYGQPTDLSVSPDGLYTASTDKAGRVCFYKNYQNAGTHKTTLLGQTIININTDQADLDYQNREKYRYSSIGHLDCVNAITWAPSLPYRVAFGANDHTVKVWYIGDALFESTNANSPYGRSDLVVWQHMTLVYRNHYHAVTDVAWSPNGLSIASASKDATAHIWNAETGAPEHIYCGHKGAINALAWSPDGSHIATASDDGSVHIWEALTGERNIAYVGHKGAVLAVAWSSNDQFIASGDEDGIIRVWSI